MVGSSLPPNCVRSRPREVAAPTAAPNPGLKALFGEEERPGVVVDSPGEPPNELPFDILLDTDHPERSVVVFHALHSEPSAVI